MWRWSTSAWEITNERAIRHISWIRCRRRVPRGPFPRRERQGLVLLLGTASHAWFMPARYHNTERHVLCGMGRRRRPSLKPAAAKLGPSQDAADVLRACATPGADIAEEYRRSDPEQVPGHPFAVPGLPDDGWRSSPEFYLISARNDDWGYVSDCALRIDLPGIQVKYGFSSKRTHQIRKNDKKCFIQSTCSRRI